MRHWFWRLLICQLGLASALLITQVSAQEKYIVLASTTSTQDSGLLKHLAHEFKASTGIDLRVLAQGSGQALATARRGDADLVLVHDRQAEEKFVRDGFGLERREVMYNDFVIVGPPSDPAKLAQVALATQAFERIAKTQAAFVSRGDQSGTHSAELTLWRGADVDPKLGKGAWYRETGSGMGATLNTSNAMNAYTLTDRATWLAFKNRANLKVLLEGDSALFNQYGVMMVNPAKHPHIKQALAMSFIDWLCSAQGQAAIDRFRIDGQKVFFANYKAVK